MCKAIDTLCDVFVNDTLVGKGENAHLKYEFDIKKVAKAGDNTLRITFFAPTTYAEKRQAEKPIPKNCNGTDGAAYMRKPHCHFGWDWGPHLPLSGITDDIWVECFDNRIVDVEIKQIHEGGKVTVKINPVVDGEGGAIYWENTKGLEIENSKFIQNSAILNHGGSISLHTCNDLHRDELLP